MYFAVRKTIELFTYKTLVHPITERDIAVLDLFSLLVTTGTLLRLLCIQATQAFTRTESRFTLRCVLVS